MEWICGTDYKKGLILKKETCFLSPFKEKGKEDATSQVNLYKAKKKRNQSEKMQGVTGRTSIPA